MLSDSDTFVLAPGVTVRDGALADEVRGVNWPLNATGAFVLARAGAPLAQIERELVAASSVPAATVRGDLLRFTWRLNGLALLNVERGGSRLGRAVDWIGLALRLAPAGAWPTALARRHPLDTRTLRGTIGGSLAATVPRSLVVFAVATGLAAQVSALAGSASVVVPLALGLGTGAGIALHESAHAVLLRGVPSALILRGRRTYLLHAAVGPARRSVVAAAGPLGVAVLGIALVRCGAVLVAPGLTAVGCPLAAHAFGLTILSGDGRVACGL